MGFIPQSLVLRSIVLDSILIYRNWSISFPFREKPRVQRKDWCEAFSSPEAALLLVSTKNRDWHVDWHKIGRVQHRNSAIHGLPVTLRMLRVKSDKSDWFRSHSYVFAKPIRTGISLGLSKSKRGDSWCWPKGARPLGTRKVSIACPKNIARPRILHRSDLQPLVLRGCIIHYLFPK